MHKIKTMKYEINVAELNAIYPHNKNAITLEVEIDSLEDFAHSIFNGRSDNKDFNAQRIKLIKKMISSFIDGVDTKSREDFFEHILEMLEDEKRIILEDRNLFF